ncbi:membrane protein [Deinococcus taeanensis]|uniref:YczE/YyaS/YitT family protein n=1 Tax=Deinococcus taeanensis TaxID=2737050 RepID=UPI001CDCE0A1|nr:membrane protein [Deinococcus taeanensis]UBV41858.1 membrane protein [Deinococcus taeanensis]
MPTPAAPRALFFPGRLGPRLALLVTGLTLYGLSLRLMLNAHVGVAPWEVLHVGITRWAPLSVGAVSILTGVVIVAFTALRLQERLGLGTLLNVLLIGAFLDLFATVVPEPAALPLRWAQFLAGVALLGLATGAYVGAGLGAGPRDGLTLALRRVTGWPVPRIRTGVEVAVLLAGWALGGPIGWGTLVFALTVGPAMGWGLRLFQPLQRRLNRSARAAEAAS